MKRALLIVNVQNDFTPATASKPAGAMAVPEGNAIVPLINELMLAFRYVVASQDWHPPNHLSFASQHPGHKVGDIIEVAGLPQVLWPNHCVQDTPGAAFVDALDQQRITHVVQTGMNRRIDSYSAFFDTRRRHDTGLAEHLRKRHITDVYIAGLATDYCVKFTAFDAAQLGFRTFVVVDACRGMELQEDDVDKALAEMRDAGAGMVRSGKLLRT